VKATFSTWGCNQPGVAAKSDGVGVAVTQKRPAWVVKLAGGESAARTWPERGLLEKRQGRSTGGATAGSNQGDLGGEQVRSKPLQQGVVGTARTIASTAFSKGLRLGRFALP